MSSMTSSSHRQRTDAVDNGVPRTKRFRSYRDDCAASRRIHRASWCTQSVLTGRRGPVDVGGRVLVAVDGLVAVVPLAVSADVVGLAATLVEFHVDEDDEAGDEQQRGPEHTMDDVPAGVDLGGDHVVGSLRVVVAVERTGRVLADELVDQTNILCPRRVAHAVRTLGTDNTIILLAGWLVCFDWFTEDSAQHSIPGQHQTLVQWITTRT